ncbi:MAG: IS5 family transposase [Candidatus Lariskella arthropodorum]
MDYYIKAREWEYIFQFLSSRKDIYCGKVSKLRLFVESIYYVARSGCQWRLLPRIYGLWRSIHKRFKEWSEKGIWHGLFQHLQDAPDMEYTMIDSTIVRSHACAAGYKKDSGEEECLGRSKGGFTTKIHALVDALGNPLKFILTAGQRNDITHAASLTQGLKDAILIADKGYDSNAFIDFIADKNSTAVIPPRKNRKVQREYDIHLYKERNLIEGFFGKIKHFRRIFSRFEKKASVFMSFLHFIGALIWLK